MRLKDTGAGDPVLWLYQFGCAAYGHPQGIEPDELEAIESVAEDLFAVARSAGVPSAEIESFVVNVGADENSDQTRTLATYIGAHLTMQDVFHAMRENGFEQLQ